MILNKNVKCINSDAVDITVGTIYHVISEGKTEAIIYDLVDQAPYLLQQGMQRKNLYKSEEEFIIYDFK